jgi:Glycosyl transferase family 2
MNSPSVWSPRSQPLSFAPKSLRRVSLVTTCMGRVEYLKRTLVQNILDNLDYPNVEFVVLNYNSPDSMHEFMTSAEIRPFIRDATVRYLILTSRTYYSFAHSRNVAVLRSTGDLFVNVDADNFTGKGFASFINLLADIQPRKAVFAAGKRRIHGRVGMYIDEFKELGGYDESLKGYGFDDQSLLRRALLYGCKLMWWKKISPAEFGHRILTPREEVGIYLENDDWQATERNNRLSARQKLSNREWKANIGVAWGYADSVVQYKL